MKRRRARHRRHLTICAVAASMLAISGSAHASSPAPGTSSTPTPTVPSPADPATDTVVSGVGEPDGFHLFIARSITNWSWEPLVILDPRSMSDQTWIGNTCVTGDGSTAVAVVAPWDAANSPAGMARGGTAYAVDLANHQARVLADQVSLGYFNPGCGTSQDVALTRFRADDDQSTEILRMNTRTGHMSLDATAPGELTSAVPVGDKVMAAHGADLVTVTAHGPHEVVALPGPAYQLRPRGTAELDLLSADTTSRGTAWRYAAGRLTRLASGPLHDLALSSSPMGIPTVFGATTANTASPPGQRLAATARSGARIRTTSALGRAYLVAPPRSSSKHANQLPEIDDATGHMLRQAQTAPTADAPRVTATTPTSLTHRQAATLATAAPAPACAVGRTDPAVQVPQPSNGQVDWAIEHAVTNSLPSRPAGFDNLPGGAYSPKADFPQPSLVGGSAHVPAVVVAGIMAQESNFNQASYHASSGTAGDPLISDYYGNGGSTDSIDYSKSDCGYGLGQITDIMKAGSYDSTVQQRVAVDYAENAAAVVRHLATTWNTLAAYSPPLTVNNADPQWLENWYTTIWAYNSGVQPTSAKYGLPSGCTQAGPPDCTDSVGNWGLGWSNNPINPIYPPDRAVFLQTSYADAATPNLWPYQERVFGWISTPLQRYSPALGAMAYAYSGVDSPLLQPSVNAFCSTSVNHCNPSDTKSLYCSYQTADSMQYHCWWNGNVTFADCGSGHCTSDQAVSTASSEPSAYNANPPVCAVDTSQVPLSTPAGATTFVTEESGSANPTQQDINVVGCARTPSNWRPSGSFALAFAQDSQGAPLGQVDFHQLGAGFGGHLFFAHTAPPSGTVTNQVVGTWTPGITSPGTYQIKVFVPDVAAVANPAQYTITTSSGTVERTVDQGIYSNQWVSLGDFTLSANASVSLSNISANGDYATDIAYSTLAFIPRGGRLVTHTIDAFSNFDQNQSLSGAPSAGIAGDFAGDDSLTQMADNLSSGVLAYPACAGNISTSCVPQVLRTAMSNWQADVGNAGGHPVQWLRFSRPTPPNPLTPGYLDDGTHYKVRATVDIDFVVQANGQIDPASYSVSATNATGITELPQFILDTFNAISTGYGIAPPDLTYSAKNLDHFDGRNLSVNPLGTGLAPGREYLPKLSVQLTNNNTCLQVQDLAGGSIGWKTLLADDNVMNNMQHWINAIHSLVLAGGAPSALASLTDTIQNDFFSRPAFDPGQWPPIAGSIFYYAPAIWVESHFNDCVTGSSDTITPAGSVGPDTNRAQLIDSSYMPDLYLAVDGKYVDKYGNPTMGEPVQRGDWPDFAALPTTVSPGNSPWNPCYIGPTTTYTGPDGTTSTIYFVSRRDGNPWGLTMLNPGDLSSTANFC